MAVQFEYQAVGKLIFGAGTAARLGQELSALGAQKVLVVMDPAVAAQAAGRRVMQRLEEAGIEAELFTDITPEPEPEQADRAAEQARQMQAQAVVGVGGGSAMDVAKAAGVLVTNPGKATDYVGLGLVKQPGLPVVCMPTTAGTGSEVTFTAVFTRRRDGFKGGINSPYLYPRMAILDPELTLGCPPKVTAAAGLDALTHAVEAYLSRAANPLSDIHALKAVELVGAHLEQAYNDGTDIDAREGMMLAAYMGGIALALAGVGLVHAMAYPLGAIFGIGHGEANAMLLPHILPFNAPACTPRLADLARAVGVEGASEEAAAEGFIHWVKELCARLGIPRWLRDAGVDPARVKEMAQRAMGVARPIANNPRPVTAAEVERLFLEAMGPRQEEV